MHHPESAGDSTGTRKMAHPAIFPRRGSNTGTGSVSSLATMASTSVSNNVIPTDDYQSPLVIQPPLPAGSSSPGPQHPHSLNLLSQSQMQSQPLPSSGAQIKKKSGFQITSVTPAQISVSTNNSIAEDTESYDDLDESHTEDLSSSEILDVSLSRATDMGGPERSSSEETLNNFHEAETPGAVSPNQPPHPHPIPQVSQHSTMVNGTAHHHHHSHHPHHHGHHHQQVPAAHSGIGPPPASAPGVPVGGAVPAAVTSTSRALPSVAQKLPASMGAVLENASVVGAAGLVAQPVAAVPPGTTAGILSAAAGATISVINPLMSNVSNVNMLSSASVPGLGGSSGGGSGAGLPPGLMNLNSSGGGVLGSSSQNVTLMQQQSGAVSASVAMTTAGASTSGAMGPVGGGQVGVAAAVQPAAAAPVLQGQAQPPQAQALPPAATSSRFRVVKLDSSSEPFRKGRWTCTEYYDKEAPAAAAATTTTTAALPAAEGAPGHRVVESLRQSVAESVVCSERESTSGSSVSSSVSTLSHYSESVSSGEAAGPSAQQAVQQQQLPPPQPQEYAQASLPGPPQSMAPPHGQPQDVVPALMKTSAAPSVPVTVGPVPQQASITQGSLQTSMGHAAPGLPQQQMTYTQAVQPAPMQVGYPPAQQPAVPATVPPTHVMPAGQGGGLPPDFTQHPAGMQAAVPTVAPSAAHLLPHLPAGAAPGQNGQMMPAGPPLAAVAQPLPQGLVQQQQQGPSPQIAPPSQGVVLPHMLPGSVSGLPQPLTRTQQLPSQLPVEQQQPPGAQNLGSQLPPAVVSSQVTSNVPPSVPGDSQSGVAQGAPPVPNGSAVAHPAGIGLALGQGALPPASALYAGLPSLTATQLEDAQRLLFQHQSLLSLPKLAAGECASEAGASVGPEDSSGVNALPASSSLFPLKTLPVDGEEDSSSGASVVAIDNKIEQAMDLVKSHLMYAVREEVEVLKEQIKELIERNSQLEQENNLLKNLASPEQLAQFQAQVQSGSPPASTQAAGMASQQPAQPASQSSGPSA
ncbi:TSC22 domain family protein 1-like isoform X1 [Megalops cyprinoides]|uniref:TSC22 domain family protein 1-like isoform X1 n=1 Tax=Megalops cyprinoides TaxID=118141 RepID=UPI001863A887|nr:TSC22 domain family protein 1-like isoform X1 [Megalops cyprinoides]